MISLFLRSVLIAGLCFPLPGTAAVDSAFRVGIVGVGTDLPQAERLYPRLEKQIERWLGDHPAWGVRAKSLGTEKEALSGSRKHLLILEQSTDPSNRSIAVEQAERSAEALSRLASAGPQIQHYRLFQAAQALEKGDSALVRARLEQAVTGHPEGTLSAIAWRGIPENAVQPLLDRIQAAPLPCACRVELTVEPASADIRVQGYAFGKQREFEFLTGRVYPVEISAEGYETLNSTVDCRRSGQWMESARLAHAKDRTPAVASLENVRQWAELDALLAVQAGAEGFSLSLYSPGRGIQKLPTRLPLTYANLSQGTAEGDFPLSGAVLTDALDQHRAAPLRVSTQIGSERGYELPRAESRETFGERKWYESRELWILSGLVAVGLATALIATRQERDIHSNPVIQLGLD
ncbi:hypothetical protein K2X33_12695 [bacterium]|nr:hypothetical protein [bacterium]